MSAADYRHFTRPADGNVISVRTGSSLERQFTDPGVDYVEVQVAPLDAVVIDGPLPEVECLSDGWLKADGLSVPPDRTPGAATRIARAHLAIAAHLREHPPVDREQVRKFEMDLGAFRRGFLPEGIRRELAEFLVTNGARMGATS